MKRAIWLLAGTLSILLLVGALGTQADDASAQESVGILQEASDPASMSGSECGQIEPLWAPEGQDFSESLGSQDFSEILGWISVAANGPFPKPYFWEEKYYNTFHSADIDGDGVDELLGRGANGMEALRFDAATNSWHLVAGSGPFSPPAYNSAGYYNTIHSGDIDGDGVDELLGRGDGGIEAYHFDSGTDSWHLVAGNGPFALSAYGSENYYNTFHSADIDGDGADELLGRGANGMEAYRFDSDTNSWHLVAGSGPFAPPAYNSAGYYNTIHSGDIDGDGVDELLGRGADGMEAYRFDSGTNSWDLVAGSGPFAPPAYNSAEYYNTIHSGDIDGDGVDELLGRGGYGMEAHRFDTGTDSWHLLAGYGPFRPPAYNTAHYYNTIHSGDIDSDGMDELLGRGDGGMTAYRFGPFREFNVLTYNTHLFGGSLVCFDWGPGAGSCWKDDDRAWAIVDKVRKSDADVVALEEVWEQAPYASTGGEPTWLLDWQLKFEQELKAFYPYAYKGRGCYTTLVLTSGLVLLSKYPLENVALSEFPTYQHCDLLSGCDYNASKGVVHATALVGDPPVPIRIGITHALTQMAGAPDRTNSSMPPDIVRTAITPFELNGETYIFFLRSGGDNAAVFRIEDYTHLDPVSGSPEYGAGNQSLYWDNWSSSDLAVESFELNGHPYLFSLKADNHASITRINDDPATGWLHLFADNWTAGTHPNSLTIFESNGHPYLFSLADNNQATITRINDDPSSGWENIYTGSRDSAVLAVRSFYLDGQPYLFTLETDDQAILTRINVDQGGSIDTIQPFTDQTVAWDSSFAPDTITSFQLNGQPYIFGLRNDGQHVAQFSRINADLSVLHQELYWLLDYPFIAVRSFELNDQPHLYALRGCCWQLPYIKCVRRPEELSLHRIHESDGHVKIERLNQYEDMQIIRDTTVRDEYPAIMMGDTNVHRSDYGFMDTIFGKAGAVDAYLAVHGASGDGMMDVVVGNIGAANQLYVNTGPLFPSDYTQYDYSQLSGAPVSRPPVVDATSSLALGDVDGDGDLDLVVGNDGHNLLYLNRGTLGGGLNDAPGSVVGTADAYKTTSVALGDVDGDGDLDLMIGNHLQVNRLFLNNGTADPFAGVQGSDISGDADGTKSVALGDVDGDGDLDLVVGNDVFRGPYGNVPQVNRLYLNNGTANPFSGVQGSNISSDAHRTNSVALGDMDGDGDLDLVAGNWNGSTAGFANRLYLNNGTANPFAGVQGSNISEDAHVTFSVALGDVDGDGDLDLVAGNVNRVNRLYLNNGTGDPFAGVEGSDISVDADGTQSVALGDVDGDGDLDLVAGNAWQRNRMYRNNGTGDPFTGVQGASISSDAEATAAVVLGDVGGGETIDTRLNKLSHQVFDVGTGNCDGNQMCFDRLDYVYVKSKGDEFILVPTSATVLRDWKFAAGSTPDMDLSDHYPLQVTFRIEAAKKLTYLPLIISP